MKDLHIDEIIDGFHFRRIEQRDKDLYMGVRAEVNERIRALMEERGWTPYRLAKESGLSEGTVGNIFRRNTVPSTATLQAICGGLKITLSQFFAEGEMIELTPELKELFGDWVNLTADQKDAVRHMMKTMRHS